jgi:hypothetical protein
MNLPALQNMQLPAHLQHLASNTALMTMNSAASTGLNTGGGGHPRISIKQSRWRLQAPQGDEVLVPTLHLDVIIVDANPHGLSKVFYESKYDPTGEDLAPTCYSDNGIGPSSRAAKPQCGKCAACPHNVWGSKISEISGKGTKACSDVKKIAVLVADNADGPVFELRIPPASLKNFGLYVDSLNKRGIPAAAIVTQLTFDPNASHPLIIFTPTSWVTAEQSVIVTEIVGTEEVDVCTGKNDVAIDPAKVAPGAAAAKYEQAAALAPTPAPLPVQPNAATQGFSPPVPPATLASAPVPPTLGAATTAPATKRTRKVSTPPEAPVASAAFSLPPLPPVAAAPIVRSELPPVVNAASAVAPLAPAGVTNSALDEMLAKAMAT